MKKDLELAFRWFTHPNNIQQTYLTPTGIIMVDELQIALSTHSLSQARQIANRLFFDANRDSKEVGEILIRSAIYAFLLGGDENYQFAKEQFQNAVGKFLDKEAHQRAISLWFLGFIYWHIYGYSDETIMQWDYCVRVLNELSYSPMSPNPDWYQKIRFQILESLFLTRMRKHYFPLSQVQHYQVRLSVRSTAQLSSSIKATRSSQPKHKRIHIRSLPVYQYVPAGGWGVVDPDEIGQAEIEHFTINDIPHHAKDLLGRGHVTINDREQYAIVRIKGTSMNKLDILKDDYVLIRRQDDANHKDIVLAERINTDPEATLKRFYKQGNTIELHPESNDPVNQVLPVNRVDELRILGIAVAVLKPLPPETSTPDTSKPSDTPTPSGQNDDKILGVIQIKLDR